MCPMNVQLPLPNPSDWMSPGATCKTLAVTPTTLDRMVGDGRLTRYKISGTVTLYWVAEVETIRRAREIAKTGVR
jgi:hypothetical protein